MEASAADVGRRRGGRWRTAAWIAACLFLLVPLVAMQLTREVDWTAGDFAFAAILLSGSLGAYELAVRRSANTAYRAGVGVALLAVFLLVWIHAAVGITDSDADVVLVSLVPAVGLVSALVARFRARGMALAMLATALAQALVAVGALIAGIVPAYNSAFEILGITGFFVALWVGSALLFRAAARRRPGRSAA